MTPTETAWFYHQSAVIPMVADDTGVRVVLVTSRRRKRWIVPKGVVEHNLSTPASAVREAYAEAGVRGVAYPTPIGAYHYHKWDGECTVSVYVMRVTEVLQEWAESKSRERILVSVEEAKRLVDRPQLCKLLDRVPEFAARPIGGRPKAVRV